MTTNQNTRARRGEVKLTASAIGGYAAAATAGALAGTANAAITYSGPLNIAVADTTTNGQAVAVDLTFGAAPAHLALAHGIGSSTPNTGYAFTAPEGFGTPGVEVAGFLAGSYNYVTNAALGAAISTLPNFLAPTINATMAFNGGYGNDQFLAAADGFIGFRFNTNQYGWVRVHMNGSPLNSFTIVDFAYGDVGDTINAGQTPAPGALGALALGAAGLVGWRRRKDTAA